MTERTSNEQTALWNGRAGHAWVAAQEALDHMFRPFEDMLVDVVSTASATRVLDVGCGTGSTTLAIARALGAQESCVGIDISEPMLDLARARGEREHSTARFIRANAQTYAFEPATFDMVVSRFGVMFFDDPVAAFANLRSAMTDEATLHAIVFRDLAANPFMTTAERAAAPFLPNLPPRKPNAPGQFAFADPRRVSSILDSSGWSGIDIKAIDVDCTFPATELTGYLTRLGPLGLALQDADDQKRDRVIEVVRAAFDPFVHGADVRFTAACWMIGATTTTR